jgi:uncharacterized cupin superfamily protein
MNEAILAANPAAIDLSSMSPEPLPQDWVLAGTPVSRSANLVRSRDWLSNVVVWECTAGSFQWHYDKDEHIFVVSGEAFLQNGDGSERRFGPGDLGFFPAGTTAEWRVPAGIRKVAVLRETMWRPLGVLLKMWNKALRVTGIAGASPL